MDFWQVMIWIIGGLAVFVVIRMLWVAMFDKGFASSLPQLGSATTTDAVELGGRTDDDVEATWIEIDIEPLFPSSEASVIDLTSEQEPESHT